VINGDGLSETLGNATAPAVGPAGYYYRIPETCEVSINFQGEILVQESLIINQAGVVRNLPPTINYVKFNTRTGGIEKLILR
jgi:hypothetical protein